MLPKFHPAPIVSAMYRSRNSPASFCNDLIVQAASEDYFGAQAGGYRFAPEKHKQPKWKKRSISL